MNNEMTKIEITIETPTGRTTYSVMAPATAEHASRVLAQSLELGCALLDAPYRKDNHTDDAASTGVDPRTIQ